MQNTTRKTLADIVSYLVLTVGALIMIAPFLWMISTSLKATHEVFTFPPTMFGEELVWENFAAVSDRFPFGRFFINSLYISAIVIVFQVLTSALAGFTFARLRFPARDSIFALYLATLIVPFHVTIVPTFWLMTAFGWVDTHYSLILPALVTPFGTFLMRQFFLTIPQDLEHAAKIDGCTPFGIFWRIFLPLTKPALATLSVFVFIHIWNDFFRPLIFINSINRMTIPLGLAAMQGMYSTNWPVLMAATVLSLAPVLIAFIGAQEYFVRGVTLSGLKG